MGMGRHVTRYRRYSCRFLRRRGQRGGGSSVKRPIGDTPEHDHCLSENVPRSTIEGARWPHPLPCPSAAAHNGTYRAVSAAHIAACFALIAGVDPPSTAHNGTMTGMMIEQSASDEVAPFVIVIEVSEEEMNDGRQ